METASLPLVSIVIPVYNQRISFLQQAVTSALDQTYSNLEVVVSNNHSTPEVAQYLDTVRDARLRRVEPPAFLPMMPHFQFALDQAKGDYISMLSSDDWLFPEAVSTVMAELLAHPSAVVGYAEIENVDHKDIDKVRVYTNRKASGFRSAETSLNELLHSRPFFAWIPGGILSRSAYKGIRHLLDGHITFATDVAMLFKLHEFGDVVYVDKPLSKFRVWTAKDGKLGGPRLLENIADLGKACQLLEESPRLMAMLRNGRADVQDWRAYQGKRWIMALLIGVITKTISPKACREGIATIRQQLSPDPAGASVLAGLLGRPQVYLARPVLNALYQLYLAVQYRTKKAF